MAYSKLSKTTSDYCIGYGAVNQLRDNLDDTKALAATWHGTTEPIALARPKPPPRPQQMGHHNDTRIPRASLAVLSTVFPGSLALIDMRTADAHIAKVERLGPGVVRLEVRDLSTFWAHGVAHATTTAQVRFVQAVSFYPTGQQAPCVVVTSYELNAGDMVPTDFDFDLHLYGTP